MQHPMRCQGCHLVCVLSAGNVHNTGHSRLLCSSNVVAFQSGESSHTSAVQYDQSYARSCLLLSAARLARMSVE